MHAVYHRFRKKLEQLAMEIPNGPFLIAVSGGQDSMTLADLMTQTGLPYAIAHCNFQLRGIASDQDETFVQAEAQRHAVPFFSIRFATRAYAQKNQIGIQEAARKLRYEWLETIRQKENYAWILTAHHLEDQLETSLFNFTRGTGLRGLLGIPEKNGSILRPLLRISREHLKIYYQARLLQHREDSSNATNQYQRNKIRHEVVPVLQQINPGLLERYLQQVDILKDTYLLFQEQVKAWKRKVWSSNHGIVRIALAELREHPALATLLYEWLQAYAYHPDQCRQIAECCRSAQTGARFFSSSHELLVDRDQLLIQVRKQQSTEPFILTEGLHQLDLPNGVILVQKVHKHPDKWPSHPWEAYLEATQLSFPLQLRHWKPGDRFSPLGMPGKHKKIQDLFSDRKINRFEKEKIWLLTDAKDRICWVIGLQVDDRFKITPTTTAYYHISFQKHPK